MPGTGYGPAHGLNGLSHSSPGRAYLSHGPAHMGWPRAYLILPQAGEAHMGWPRPGPGGLWEGLPGRPIWL